MRKAIAILSAASLSIAMLASFGVASAASFTISPWIYNPGNVCPTITSTWDFSVGNSGPSLHITKPCTTPTEAASGATINGVSGITLTELNFDYMGYCGAGAPRFNVVTQDDVTHFLGCASATKTDLGNGWTHAVLDPANPTQAFPVLAPTDTVKSIDIVFDEGTDAGTGSVYLDNISVNNMVVGGPTAGESKELCKKYGWQTMTDANSNGFKNQGQCVSYFAKQKHD